jgi:hypothetical protein
MLNKPRDLYDCYFVILGAGGIGANLAMRCRSESIPFMIFDDDTIELSNLNRIPLPIFSVGLPKVEAIEKFLSSSNKTSSFAKDCIFVKGSVNSFDDIVTASDKKINENKRIIVNGNNYKIFVVDCRDTLNPDVLFPEIEMKLTYDGGSLVCISRWPSCDARKTLSFGDGGSAYDIIPSFFPSPNILIDLFFRVIYKHPEIVTGNFEEKDKYTRNYTFQISDLMKQAEIGFKAEDTTNSSGANTEETAVKSRKGAKKNAKNKG